MARKPPKDPKNRADTEDDGLYVVADPGALYAGKSYSDMATDWFNWFISADADNRNSGPVVFLRSRGLPSRQVGANISDVQSLGNETDPLANTSSEHESISTGYLPSHKRAYVNDPNIRIGGDRLRIFKDQAVFVPIIVSYWLRLESCTDWGTMKDFTGLTIDYGDNPPNREQLRVNEKPVQLARYPILRDEDIEQLKKKGSEGLELTELDMRDFRINTPIFSAVVPDVQYGRSLKDFLEESPIDPGVYPAMVEGYFVLLRFLETGNYWVHSWASGPRETTGPYFSELLYQIEVTERLEGPHGRVTTGRPPRNERILNAVLNQKTQNGDLTTSELDRFKRYVQSKTTRVRI
jgi:hypothetical protein